MTHPSLPWCLAALCGGIVTAAWLPPSPLYALAPPLLAAACWRWRRQPGFAPCCRLLFITLGLALAALHELGPRQAPELANWLPQPLHLQGRVLQRTPRADGAWLLDLEQVRVCREGDCLPVRGRIRLYGDAAPPAALPGDRLWVRTKLRQPRAFGTPGEFDYARELARRGIRFTGFVPTGDEVALVGGEPDAGLTLAIGRWRQRIADRIERSVAPPAAPLVSALAIGEKGALSPAKRQQLTAAGVAHLFALSGLHVGLVGWMLYLAGRRLYRRSSRLLLWQPPQRLLPLLLLPLLVLYLLLAGAEVATQRALLGAAAVAILAATGRVTAPLRILAAAMLVLLLLQPLHLFNAGFQLSFAGVAGILLAGTRWSRRLRGWPPALRLPAQLLAVTAAATLATAPLVLWHFHQLPPAGLLFNLWALPVVSWGAVPLALLGALLTVPLPALAGGCLQGCALAVELALAPAAPLLAWTPLQPWFAWLSARVILVVAAAVLVLLLPGSQRRRLAGAAMLAGLALLLHLWPGTGPPLRLHAFGVGQGEALLLSFDGREHWLLDGGGLRASSLDVGERLLAPALGWLGVRQLAGVVLSHRHPDHYLGLTFPLQHWPTAGFWAADPLSAQPEELRQTLRSRAIPLHQGGTDWHWLERTPERELALLGPAAVETAENDRTLVLYARYGGQGVLLTGDLEAAGVDRLLTVGVPGPVTLLKLPHHGSGRSDTMRLVEALRPTMAFVSCGADNPFGFPAPALLQQLEARQIEVFRTDRDGTLQFDAGPAGWVATRWNRGFFR